MARLLDRVVEEPRVCSYLPDQRASLDTRVMVDVTAAELEQMITRGWRRFGPFYFRPVCNACGECVSIRVPLATFSPNRSQKRAVRAIDDLRVEVGVPRVDSERLDLYARWHAMREETKGWEPSPHDVKSYSTQFAFPHPAAREIAFYHGTRLIGLGLSDQMPNAWSLVFFFYDPEERDRSLGVANVLVQFELAKQLGIPYAYLGYRVMGCRSMEYKARYRPHELLVGRPGVDETPEWTLGV